MIHTSISDSGSIPLSSTNGAAMASTGYQASDWSLLGQSKTITANNIVSFSRQTAPVAAWSFREMGSDQPYYPIDPWTLEGVLFNCAAMSLKEAKIRQNRFYAKSYAKYIQSFLCQILCQIPKILLKNNSQSSQNIKKDWPKSAQLMNKELTDKGIN